MMQRNSFIPASTITAPPPAVMKPPERIVESTAELVLGPVPQPPEPTAYFTIEPPEKFQFPLKNSKIQGMQLIQSYFPQDINSKIDDHIVGRIERINRYRERLCVMGRGKGLLVGDRYFEAPGICSFAYGSKWLVIATEDRSLALYSSLDFKLIKVFKDFSQQKLTFVRILTTPATFEGLVLLTSTGRDLLISRIEKSFFSGYSVKLKAAILTKLNHPVTHMHPIPAQLKHYLQKDVGYRDTQLICVMAVDSIFVLRFALYRLTFDKFWDTVFQRRGTKQGTNSVSWGQAIVSSTEKEIFGERVVMTFSFANLMYLACLSPIEQYLDGETKIKLEWVVSHPLELGTGLAFCQYMCKNQLLMITEDNQVIVVHNTKLPLFDRALRLAQLPCIRQKFTESLKSQLVDTIGSKKIDFDYDMSLLEEGDKALLQEVPLVSFGESFSYEYASNEIYFLTDRKFGIYVYFDWKQICDHMRVQLKFESAMKFMLAIFYGVNRFDLGTGGCNDAQPNQKLSEYAHFLSVEYLRTKLGNLKNMPGLAQKLRLDLIVSVPIDFLLKMKEYDFLFSILRDKIANQTNIDLFYQVLQPYIEHGRVSYIPQQPLRDTLDYYISKDRLDLVERLAIYFDLALIDRGVLMQYLLQHNLVVSLANICTQGNEIQFVTPFVKFWGLSDNQRRRGNSSMATSYALRALWYIKLCLQRNMALKQYSLEKYAHMIGILTANFFTKKMIMNLLQISSEACLQTLSYYFSTQIREIVNTSPKIKLQDIRVANWVKKTQSNQPMQRMLCGIFDFMREVGMDSNDQQLWHLLLSRVVLYKSVKLTRSKYTQLMAFLINHYTTIKKIRYGLDPDKVKDFEQRCSQDQADQIMSSDYLTRLLVLMLQEEPDIREELDNIYGVARLSPLTELQAEISRIQGKFRQCVDIYLRCRENSRKRIFSFLQNTFRNFTVSKNKKSLSEMAHVLSDYVTNLIAIDASACRNLVQTYMPEAQESLIFALSGDPELQLDYLKGIIHDASLADRAQLLYVELMCKYSPSELVESLKANPHLPIQQALRICEVAEAYDAMEYIYERMGNVQKAVEIASLRIEKVFQERIRTGEVQQSYMKIAMILEDAIETCVKNHTESIWESLLDSAIALFMRYKDNPEVAAQMHIFYDINAKILYYMSNHSSVDHLVELLQNKYATLDMGGSMKKAFIEILSNSSYTQSILFSVTELAKQTYSESQWRQIRSRLKAFHPDHLCNSCQYPITRRGYAMAFMCGHIYHRECVPQSSPTFCTICLAQSNEQLNFYLSIPNPSNPKIKIEKLFTDFERKRMESKEFFRVQDYQQEQRDKHLEQEELKFTSKQDRFKRFDDMVDIRDYNNEKVVSELKDKFDKLRVY